MIPKVLCTFLREQKSRSTISNISNDAQKPDKCVCFLFLVCIFTFFSVRFSSCYAPPALRFPRLQRMLSHITVRPCFFFSLDTFSCHTPKPIHWLTEEPEVHSISYHVSWSQVCLLCLSHIFLSVKLKYRVKLGKRADTTLTLKQIPTCSRMRFVARCGFPLAKLRLVFPLLGGGQPAIPAVFLAFQKSKKLVCLFSTKNPLGLLHVERYISLVISCTLSFKKPRNTPLKSEKFAPQLPLPPNYLKQNSILFDNCMYTYIRHSLCD